MVLSAMKEQRDNKLLKETYVCHPVPRDDANQNKWKVLVIDEGAKKIIDNVIKEDDILNENITNIERIEEKRESQPDTDAIYILTPEPHIVDCVMADFERRKYKRSYLIWTALLDPPMRRRIDVSKQAQEQLAGFDTLSIDFYPRESHLITLRDPSSFPILYHPACNGLVLDHMQMLAQKITGICVTLGEYPNVRYYKPRNPIHEANVLCTHVARFVQAELDAYAKYNQNFPAPTTRPRGILIITDRCMDLVAPLIHEFTYQAMAHDLLPIKEGDKVTYKTIIHQGEPDEEEKEMELGDHDKVWVDNRHIHMYYAIDKIRGDFKKFIDDNPHFTNSEANSASINTIKDMMAGLSQFQATKELYSLHLGVATDCMSIFTNNKLLELKAVEQALATGLDDEYKKPKNIAMEMIPLLDDESVNPSDRLRLIMMYILHRDGVIPEDIRLLLQHAGLPLSEEQHMDNMAFLGAYMPKTLREKRSPLPPLFPPKSAPAANEDYALTRFEPAVKSMLEEVTRGTLSQATFPYVNPPLDNSDELQAQSQTSLRSAKPTWARNRMSTIESRQRIIVFMAGGATYSESRACYDVSKTSGRDIFLATSHMLTPSLYLKQVGDLTAERRRLDLPQDRPKPKAPAHLFERNDPPRPVPARAPVSSHSMGGLPSHPAHVGAPRPPPPPAGLPTQTYDARLAQGMANMSVNPAPQNGSGKLEKKGKYEGVEEEKKKKKGLFHRSKK